MLSAYFKVEQPNNSGIDDILVPIVKHSCTYSSELVNRWTYGFIPTRPSWRCPSKLVYGTWPASKVESKVSPAPFLVTVCFMRSHSSMGCHCCLTKKMLLENKKKTWHQTGIPNILFFRKRPPGPVPTYWATRGYSEGWLLSVEVRWWSLDEPCRPPDTVKPQAPKTVGTAEFIVNIIYIYTIHNIGFGKWFYFFKGFGEIMFNFNY